MKLIAKSDNFEQERKFGTFPRGFSKETTFPWPLVPAGELVELRYGKSLTGGNRQTGNIPVFGTNGRCGWHDAALVKGPGVILGRKGMGPLGVEWCDSDFWVIDTAYFASPKRSDLDLRYFYYLTKYVGLNHLKDGTSNPSLSRESFYLQLFPLPSLPEQHGIARVLTEFDNKTALNTRMNQTLEAMARAIFKSWFVDFETRAPRPGWSEQPLDSVAAFLNGLALQKYPARDGEKFLPVIKIADLRRSDTSSSDRANLDVPPDYVIEDGTVLFSWSGSLEVVVWSGGPGALNQHIFKVTSDKYPKWFYLYWLKEHLPSFRTIAADKATTMGHIQRHHLSEASVVVPTPDILEEMDLIMAPLLERQFQNSLESRTLATLRDTLLPKLLSGEIRVKQAEKIAGEAM